MKAVWKQGRARARANVLPFPHAGALTAMPLGRLLPSGRAVLLGFALLAGAAVAYVGARETSVFAVRTVEVSGAPPRVAAHVRAALRPLSGTSLLSVSGADIAARLERLPDVGSATYDRDFPHTIRIQVTPAHSVAVVRRGAFAWIASSTGRIVRTSGVFSAPMLPRIWLPRAADVDVGTTLADEDAIRAIRAVASARSAGFATRIAAVRASDDELTFVLASGIDLRFGGAEAFAEKLAVARRILPLAGDTGYVDVSVPERPVAGADPQPED